MIRHLVLASILASVFAASVASTATARTPYDGAWSVLIVTQRGICDSYRYGVNIVNGRIVYDGGMVNFTGRVTQNGSVRVNVAAGSARAAGSGRLTRNSGRGSWQGQSGGDRCTGFWSAERR